MNVLNGLLCLMATLLLPLPSHACSCLPPAGNPFKAALYSPNSGTIFVGKVLKKITPDIVPMREEKFIQDGMELTVVYPMEIPPNIEYLVKVRKPIKGLGLDAGDHVIVNTASNGGMCGVGLTVGDVWLLSGYQLKIFKTEEDHQLRRKKVVTVKGQTSVGSCGLNRIWDQVSQEDKKLVRQYSRKALDEGTCVTGKDHCLNGDYCDDGRCVDSGSHIQCPFWQPPAPACFDPVTQQAIDPCAAAPCAEAGKKAFCIVDQCYQPGKKCQQAIWMDRDRTRVCNGP